MIRRTLDARLERGQKPTKAAVRGAIAEVITVERGGTVYPMKTRGSAKPAEPASYAPAEAEPAELQLALKARIDRQQTNPDPWQPAISRTVVLLRSASSTVG